MLTAAQRRYIRIETTISAVINMAISALFVWVAFRGMSAIPLWGNPGLALDLIPTCFAITLMSGIVLTLLTRARLRRGQVAPIGSAQGIAAFLPRNVVLRAIGFALVVTVIAVPLTTGVLMLVDADGVSYGNVMIFKIAYGALLALAISPPLLERALADSAGVRA